ncbi:MAG: SLBB domain-containing protein [Geobacteraceae bacterium]|nr:SLBB domain-containing protein [Geobacteraceae bacterium]
MKRGNSIFISLLLLGASFIPCHGAFAAGVSQPVATKSAQQTSTRPAMTTPFQLFSTATIPSRVISETDPLKRREGAKPGTGAESEKLPGAESGQPAQADLSPIEQAVLAEEQAEEKAEAKALPQPYRIKSLSQFGYNFFRPSAAGFAPLTDIPVGADYVIGPGDRIVLSLWGSVEGTHELEVNRSGEIVLPRVGTVKVWGITFGRLPDVLKGALSKVFKDFELNVTMGKLRVIKVFVVGEVKAPGDYNLSSLSTLINALAAAGGPVKTGTLRNIQVKRAGKVVETADLYDFFLKGDKSRDIRLQPGDTIFVPVIGRVAGIAGNVKRPAIYELREERNLGDLIALAEGLLPTGYLQRVQISRVEAHEKKLVTDFNIDPKGVGKSLDQVVAAIPIQDMDIVKIFPISTTLRDHVRLNGYVLRPGDYALQPGMRLSRLLAEDNLLPEYYKAAAEITRLYPPDYHPEKIFVNVAKALVGDPGHDLELREFDEVRIFSRWEMEEMPTVKVNGEVQRPGEYRLFTNMTVRDLLMLAGNPKITAYRKNAEINRIRWDCEAAMSFPITINLEEAIKGSPKDNLALAPFDELTVRKIPNWAEEKERYVALQGEVQFPGVYPVYKGERLSSVIERAGGFTDRAYLRGAKFTRRSLQEEQQKRMEEVIARTEQDILKKQGELTAVAASKEELEATKASLEGLLKSLEKLKSVRAEGRMVIRLTQLADFRNSQYDLELLGGDTLLVPRTPNAVNVMGQVYNPTTLLHIQGKEAAYYLNRAGGPTRDAEEGEMYIIKADGTVASRQQTAFGFRWDDEAGTWNFSKFLSADLEAGDTLVVPQRLERIAWMREIKDITTILSQIALTAGVIVAAGL